MALGKLPALPAKARLTTLRDPDELRSRDYLPLHVSARPTLSNQRRFSKEEAKDEEGRGQSASVSKDGEKRTPDVSGQSSHPADGSDCASAGVQNRHPLTLQTAKLSPQSEQQVSVTANGISSLGCPERSTWSDKREDKDGAAIEEFGLTRTSEAAHSVANTQGLRRDSSSFKRYPRKQCAKRSQNELLQHDTETNQSSFPTAYDLAGSSPTKSEGSKSCQEQATTLDSPEFEMPPVVEKHQNYVCVENTMDYLPITRAIRRGDNSLVIESLRQGENPNAVCSHTGQTYLHVISWQASGDREVQWVPMVYQLSNAGADMNARDKSGCLAVGVALRRKLVHVLAALLKCGAVLGVSELEEAESIRGVARTDLLEVVRRFTPGYWEAVLDPTSFKVSRLVKAWARINVSRRGQTLIEYAKQNARDPTVTDLLLQHEASIELAHAVMAGDSERTRLLLCHGAADLATADFSVRHAALNAFSPLSLTAAAERYGHGEVLSLLLKARGTSGGTSLPSRYPLHLSWQLNQGSGEGGLVEKGVGGTGAGGVVYQGRTFERRAGSGATAQTSALCAIL